MPKPNYIQRKHHEAVALLGAKCVKCDTQYKPGTGNLHMMRVGPIDANISQYKRDSMIVDNPEWGNAHYVLMCVPCRPKFEEISL